MEYGVVQTVYLIGLLANTVGMIAVTTVILNAMNVRELIATLKNAAKLDIGGIYVMLNTTGNHIASGIMKLPYANVAIYGKPYVDLWHSFLK